MTTPRQLAPSPHRLTALRFTTALLIAAAPVLWADQEEIVATVADQVVSRAELLVAAAFALEENEMTRLRCQVDAHRGRHEVLQSSLQQLVRGRLLDLETARTGHTFAAMEARIQQAMQPVGQLDIESFYLRNQARIPYPLNEVAGQIRGYLEQQAIEHARDQFFSTLEERFTVGYRLGPLRFEVAADGFAAHGPPDAAVTIVEFSDFQCPFCVRLLPTLEQAKRQYAGKLRVVYRHFPLVSIHPHAQKAAEASLCAREQGRFWELHDLMFAEQDHLAVADLKEMARRLGLDGAAFDQCLDADRHYEAVRDDIRAGVAAGVSGTPALFINGRFLGGAVPFESLAAIIDEELARPAQP